MATPRTKPASKPRARKTAPVVSDYQPLNAHMRRDLEAFVTQVIRATAPRPRKPQTRSQRSKADRAIRTSARKATGEIWHRIQRSAATPPPGKEGAGWLGWLSPLLVRNDEQQRIWSSEGGKYAHLTKAGGPTPQSYSTRSIVDLTLDALAQIYRECNVQGVLIRKADLDYDVAQSWGHAQAAHRQRIAAVYRNPLQLRPRSKTPLAHAVCKFVRGVLDDIPGFIKAEEDLLSASRYGMSAEEVIWREPADRKVAIGKSTVTVRGAKSVRGLEWIHNREWRYDTSTRRYLYDSGANRFVDPFENPDGTPTHKVIFHGGPGEGDPHRRGYGFVVDLLYLLSHQSLARWSVVLEYFGVATPYLSYDPDGFADDNDQAQAEAFLGALGRGIPGLLHRKYGEVKLTETPTGIDARGQHAAILGYLNAEASKVIAGQTLLMEAGGSGSYALASAQGDTKEDVQIIDARLESDTQTWQTVRYIVEENAAQLARAFGVTVDEVLAVCPVAYRVVDRRVDPAQRLGMFATAVKPRAQGGLGLNVDPEQIAEECNFRLLEDDELPELPDPAAEQDDEQDEDDQDLAEDDQGGGGADAQGAADRVPEPST